MKILTHTVKPKIPESLLPLDEMAHNLWMSWNFDAIMLFIRLDYEIWRQSKQNPAKLLGMVPQERFDEMAADDSFLAALRELGGEVVVAPESGIAPAKKAVAARGFYVETTSAATFAAFFERRAAGVEEGLVVLPLCGAGLKSS